MQRRYVDAVRFLRFRLDLTQILLVCVLALFAGTAQAAPKVKVWQRWKAHDPSSLQTVDHGAWDRFLGAYLVFGDDGVNRVAYGRVAPDDRRALDAYVDRLAGTPVGALGRDEQLAYWINLYNALTVRTVLDHYPVHSIRDIGVSPGWFSVGPWGAKLVAVEGTPVSLDDIEHRILRPIWRDPRVHYAVNCAALGCPNLRPVAFTAANAQTMLDGAARAYVNHKRGVTVGRDGLVVSSLYKWYREDFGGGEAGVLAHLKRYAAPDLKGHLDRDGRIAGYAYDWSLNDAGAVS